MRRTEFFYEGNKGKFIAVCIFRLKGNFVVHSMEFRFNEGSVLSRSYTEKSEDFIHHFF